MASIDWRDEPITDNQYACIDTLSSKLGRWVVPQEAKKMLKNKGEASRAIYFLKELERQGKKITDENFKEIFGIGEEDV